jgi:predicted AAA+ superfamily ATPase
MVEPRDVLEETTSYALERPLRPRDIDLDSIAKLAKLKIVAVTGVRRAGKSSVLMLLAQHLESKGEKVGYVNAEDTRLQPGELLDNALRWFGDDGYLIIDEVTSAGDWAGWLSRNHEMLKGKLKIIVSSSRSGLAHPPKALRGRIFTVEVFPLSFKESLEFKHVKVKITTAGGGKIESALDDHLRYGGFPEIALLSNDAERSMVLNDYFREILALDVAEASRSDVSSLKHFGRYVLNSPYFSASRCLNHLKSIGLKVGKERILEWEHHSQESYLFFFVPVFGRSIKIAAQYPRKAFPVDTGFLYGVGGMENKGRLLECMVFLELRRSLRPGEEIAYWRDDSGKEVDLLVKRGSTVRAAYQACWDLSDTKTRSRDISSLEACMDELSFENGFIVTRDTARQWSDQGRVRIVDGAKWSLTRNEGEGGSTPQ